MTLIYVGIALLLIGLVLAVYASDRMDMRLTWSLLLIGCGIGFIFTSVVITLWKASPL